MIKSDLYWIEVEWKVDIYQILRGGKGVPLFNGKLFTIHEAQMIVDEHNSNLDELTKILCINII